MWSNQRPPSRTAPGDYYNNNQVPTNPYSRNAGTPKPKPGRQSTDPWDWGSGWDDNSSAQQDEWNNGWNQPHPPAPAPNLIPNPAPPLYHPVKQDKKTHGTPDLIPEKINNGRGNMMQMGQQPPRYNQVSNAKEFFDIDLVAQNHQTPLPPMCNAPEVRRPQQPVTQDYQMFQQVQPPQNRHNSPASYFQQVHPSQGVNNESMFYNHPPMSHSPNSFQNSQYYQPEPIVNNQMMLPEHSNNHYGQNTLSNPPATNYYDQNTFMNVGNQSFEPIPKTNNAVEVENVEVAPPERLLTPANHPDHSRAASHNTEEINRPRTDESNIPDNQETVPDNEEHLQNLPQKMNQMKISSTHNFDTWNNSPGWENQEVAPRCELDRNQYLETGQLDANETDDIAIVEQDNNDEGEALPPPGLDRMVTGQGTESISQRSVLGQLPSSVPGGGNGFVRLVPGQPTPSESPEPSSMERLVTGQQNNEELSLNSSQRMVPGQQSLDSQTSIRFTNHQEQQNELHRMVQGQTQNESSLSLRMIPGQLSDDETNPNTNDLERCIPVGTSENDNNFSRNEPDEERMVPGGMSDGSRSQSMSIDDDTRVSSERVIPGMTESTPSQPDNERLVTGAGSVDVHNPPQPIGSPDGSRHVIGHSSNGSGEPSNQPPPGLHRLVLGQINSEAVPDADHPTGKQAERTEESSAGNPPSGMHRMVLGQFREKEPDIEVDKEIDPAKTVDREEDSDSDYRSDRRRHRHRKDSFEDDRKERDYSSEREYRGKRDERREYRKKRDDSYNRSPEYRSDHEDYERNDYRDRRDRERRDRPRDRERRRRSPDFNYDPYYRDDPRKLPPRERDRRYYEPYDEDPYYYRENRSRPSSRSGSDYRRHRDYPPRQPYYQDQGYMHYYQIQQYYENMRRTDPQAYALWYERYMAEKFGAASNDRVSVSGRSSVNENSHTNENDEDREDIKVDDAVSHRSTPPLYNSTHIRGQFNTLGQLVIVNPHDPFSYGEHQAKITICKVSGPNAADSPDTLEFLSNPGPFISGVTHKNTVLQYLKKQCDQFSHSSEKLLYELIRLVIKLNGVVDMTDVADLLIESYRSSNPEEQYCQEIPSEAEESPPLSPQQVTAKFRDLLLEGNKTEALEWAMKNKDWGHALFLASKMDSRTHNNVMLRFANGLQTNDPLQTLYQLMSGREPQAATCAADKKWGDWRPHLAMMLSNRTSNLELDRKSILSLGDSLGARGRLYAAHFCYLTAQLEFSNYSDRHAKLVLLGASPDKPFAQFASCRAIMLTLCYEYAKQLSNKEWCIPTLRPYKFLLACRLFDHGNITASLAYLESLAQDIVRLPSRDDRPLIQLVVDMADKIKCADSTLAYSTEPATDPDWLARLKYHYEETNDPNFLANNMVHGISTSTVSELEPLSGADSVPQASIQDVNQVQYPPEVTSNYQPDIQNSGYVTDNYYDPAQNNYYNPSQNVIPPQENHQMTGGYLTEQQPSADVSAVDYWTPNTNTGWEHQQQPQQQEPLPVTQPSVDAQPQISVKPGFGYYGMSEDMGIPQVQQPAPAPTPAAPPSDKAANKDKASRRTNKTQQSGSGWFGGIWDKLALRPKNQMKLPDDKNPSIVWDEKTKRWVNTDASEEEQSVQLKPPPKASELNGSLVNAPAAVPAPTASSTPGAPPAPMAGGAPATNMGLPPPSSTSANKYKLQRGKGMRSNYVDVMGANKKPSSTSVNPQPFTTMPQAPVTNFFVPAPIAGNENAPVDFLSPSGPVSYEPSSSKSDDAPPPLSRSSSASSLSREVTYYMSRRPPAPRTGGFGKGNSAFYNTSNYQS